MIFSKVKGLLTFLACALCFAGGFTTSSSLSDATIQKLKKDHAEQALALKEAEEEKRRGAELRYAAQAEADADHLETLKGKLNELNAYLEASPAGGNGCLSRADTERLRDLW